MEYKIWLRDLIRSYVHDTAVLFTLDIYPKQTLDCGMIPDVLATVDFGLSS